MKRSISIKDKLFSFIFELFFFFELCAKFRGVQRKTGWRYCNNVLSLFQLMNSCFLPQEKIQSSTTSLQYAFYGWFWFYGTVRWYNFETFNFIYVILGFHCICNLTEDTEATKDEKPSCWLLPAPRASHPRAPNKLKVAQGPYLYSQRARTATPQIACAVMDITRPRE